MWCFDQGQQETNVSYMPSLQEATCMSLIMTSLYLSYISYSYISVYQPDDMGALLKLCRRTLSGFVTSLQGLSEKYLQVQLRRTIIEGAFETSACSTTACK
jgi:hypothetical protein